MQFSNIIGQSELKQHLIQEVNSGKISHAKLFLGQEGYGTLPLVLAFVQYLYCKNKQEQDSCGTCDACLKVANLQHPDVHFSYPTVQAEAKTSKAIYSEWRKKVIENPYFDMNGWTFYIDPKGRKPIIGSDESLEIIKSLALKSYEGGYKVMIIWGMDEMNTASANKLLKILEEPPAKTLFLLVASSQDKMLQTILSRAQITRVPRIETDELSLYLRKKFDLSISNSDSITLRSEGNLIDALAFANDSTQLNDDRELFIELMRVCYKKDVNMMLDWSEKIGSDTRERQKNFLQYCLHMFRQSLLKNYTDEVLLRVSKDEADFLKNFARFITGNNITDFHETFNNAHYYIERNANPKLIFTNVCFNVMRYIHVA
jgi:DNA polymerase-3 subunit delta'